MPSLFLENAESCTDFLGVSSSFSCNRRLPLDTADIQMSSLSGDVALWLYTIFNQKQKFMGCVTELAFQLTHNSRLSIGYQTVIDAHKNKGLKGSNSLL